jgi:hypothetical protein
MLPQRQHIHRRLTHTVRTCILRLGRSWKAVVRAGEGPGEGPGARGDEEGVRVRRLQEERAEGIGDDRAADHVDGHAGVETGIDVWIGGSPDAGVVEEAVEVGEFLGHEGDSGGDGGGGRDV